MSYDAWKLATPPEYDDEPAPDITDERHPRVHYVGIYPELVDMECPTCCRQTPVAIRPNPYFTTHRLRSGDECPSSRTWVSRRSVDARCAEILAARSEGK